MKMTACTFLLTASLVAQTPKVEPPALDNTTTLALRGVVQEFQNAQKAEEQVRQQQDNARKEFEAINQDFQKAHPGWHLNPQNFVVEKDQAKQ